MSLSVPPPVALVADERIVACHAVEYSDRVGVAWLTSMRVILRADQPHGQTRLQDRHAHHHAAAESRMAEAGAIHIAARQDMQSGHNGTALASNEE